MKTLKSLELGSFTLSTADPVLNRRLKMVDRLEQQKALAKDPLHVETTYRWVKNAQGVKERIKLEKPIRPWWKVDPLGKVLLKLKYGSRTLEFEKGKNAFVLKSVDDLETTIDTIIKATKAGELDALLIDKAVGRGFVKKKSALLRK